MFDFLIAGIHAPIFLLVLTGFTVGIVGGFIGVGGGYIGAFFQRGLVNALGSAGGVIVATASIRSSGCRTALGGFRTAFHCGGNPFTRK